MNLKMKKIEYLNDAAKFLKMNDVLAELDFIKSRLNSESAELILPIVGEFSSGKTTFINKLTDGKKLETASKPTTSVIYEIYFGNAEEKAEIIYDNDEIKIIKDINSIKNEHLKKVKRVKIFDTSKKIESNTVLVDTPGLSSNDPKHVEALSNYLPNADAVFLFVDINQQITNSLLDFIITKNLLHLPIYVVITKSETKTKKELEEVKQYISKNINLDIENIISISSENEDLEEFSHLMSNIQKSKKNIINKALDYRLEKLAGYLKTYIQSLIQNISSDSNIEEEIKSQRRKLERTLKAIDDLVHDVRNDIDEVAYGAVKQFENHISSKLNTLITSNGENIDNDALGAINSTANLMFSNYQNEIKRKLFITAAERKYSQLEIPLRSIESIDFSGVHLGQLSYNMNLSEAGHSTVKGITTGIKIAAVIGAVVVTAGAAGAAVTGAAATGTVATGAAATGTVATGAAATGAAATGAAAIGTAANLASKAGTLVSVADTVSDVASIQSNRNLSKKILEKSQKTGKYFEEVQQNIKIYDKYNDQVGQMVTGKHKLGFLEAMVSSTTDGIIGKPERKRIINKYLNDSLNPEFKNKLTIISSDLLRDMQNSLNEEATTVINQLEERLTELDDQRRNEKEDFNTYKKRLEQHLDLLK